LDIVKTTSKTQWNIGVRGFIVLLFTSFIFLSLIPVSTADASTAPFKTVTFVENDSPTDPVYSTQTANGPTSLTTFANLSPSFVNNGFNLVDWNTSADGTGTSYANGSIYSFASAEVLYAIWIANFHTVSFAENDSPSDSIYAIQTRNSPTALTSFSSLSPALTNPGFKFVDWNTESNGGGTAFSDGSIYDFSGPMILYAIWAVIPTTTLNFESNSGSGTVSSMTNQTGTSTTLPSSSGISNPGYTFVGWNTAPDGSGTEYAAGGTYVFTVNETLYAQWTPDTYTVTYSYDGGVASQTSANYVVGTTALILPTPTFAGNTFDGWFSAETGGTLIGSGGASYSPTGSIQVYAQWTPIALAILTFDANGGIGSIAPTSIDVGASTILPSNPGMTKTGYTFNGWNTRADGSGTQYAGGSNLVLISNLTLFAQWITVSIVTVTFNANGGSGSIEPINGTLGSTITLPDQSGMIRAGYQLIHWNTSATGSGTSYTIGGVYKVSGSTILYAQWSGHKVAALFGAIGIFKGKSSMLSAALKSQINRVAHTIKSRNYHKVSLFGYTSATGLRSFNVALSRSRAVNVAIFLRHQLRLMKVKGVTISTAGEGAIAGQSSNAYSRVEVFGV
jgi:uncharacterized repeat protein (TIGR02543 family)